MKQVTIGGLEIAVEKKKIKNMYIHVRPGMVKITAPRSISDETVRRFALSRIAWIREQQARLERRQGSAGRQYVSGELHELWGRRYPLDVICSTAKNSICLRDQRIVLQVREDSTAGQRARLMDEWYRKLLKEALPAVAEKYEEITGVKAQEWRVKNMRTRWGTCNIAAKRIWINLQLAKKPPKCLESVVVHELVHLLERTHNAIFYGYMDHFFPQWRAVGERLNARALDPAEQTAEGR